MANSNGPEKCYQAVFFEELYSLNTDKIKIIGRLVSSDPVLKTCVITCPKGSTPKFVTVNVEIVSHSQSGSLLQGSLYQFFGYLNRSGDDLVIDAELARNVDGLDIDLNHKAIKLQREYLQSLKDTVK